MSSPTPSTSTSSTMTPAMAALRDTLTGVNDITVWNHCLGLRRLENIPPIANELANHIIVVCLDCEHWSDNSDLTTEIGIGMFKTQDMIPLVRNNAFGDHGENMMKRIKLFLLRVIEHSHLPRSNPNSRGVEGNRFGAGRFVNFEDARNVLRSVFVQQITNVASLQGFNHPIVVLGQDIAHDKDNLKGKDVAFDIDGLGTVVRNIDTQILTRDAAFWLKPRQEIGLRRLVADLDFEHSDPHTAANDVGRTLICAFQLALGKHPCKKNPTKSMLQVATGIEAHSRATFQSIGGSEQYCWKCGSHSHMQSSCKATGLRCNECWKQGRHEDAATHIQLHCMHIAREKAIARRKKHELERLTGARAAKRSHTHGKAGLAAPRGPPSSAYGPPGGYTGGPGWRGISGGSGGGYG